MVAEARQHSERMVGEAREEAARISATAKREYEASAGRAKAEADRLIENGNLSYEKAVQEGIKEQQRLVSQTETVQAANAESPGSSTQLMPRPTGCAANATSTSTASSRSSRSFSTERCGRLAAAATSCAPLPARTTTRRASHRGKPQEPSPYDRSGDA